ncbi:MAG: hypothetical protein IKP77_02575 [Acholeplasmatales bacterium]|nr:hypothetical protein [Acholeplasmatales bacterium]
MRNKLRLLISFLFVLFLFACGNSKIKDSKNVEMFWSNWYDVDSKTSIKLYGDIELIDMKIDGGNTLLGTLTYFNSNGDIYYNDEKVKICDDINKLDNYYFYNNNYFSISKNTYENKECYLLSTLNTQINIVDEINHHTYYYFIPLPPSINYSHLDKSLINKIFELYDFEYLNNFYSKFTDYVTINKTDKTIKIVAEELYLSNHSLKPDVFLSTTIDFQNKIINVKTDNFETVL